MWKRRNRDLCELTFEGSAAIFHGTSFTCRSTALLVRDCSAATILRSFCFDGNILNVDSTRLYLKVPELRDLTLNLAAELAST